MNWPWSSKQQLVIDYWLPITKVNVTGTVVSATTSYGQAGTDPGPVKDKATPAVVSVVTRPDYSDPCQLSVLAGKWAERQAKLGLLPDGGLASADTSAQDDHGEGLKAALTMAALGAGVGGSFGPAGAAIGAGAGLIAGSQNLSSEVQPTKTARAMRSGLRTQKSAAAKAPSRRLVTRLRRRLVPTHRLTPGTSVTPQGRHSFLPTCGSASRRRALPSLPPRGAAARAARPTS